MKIFAPQNIPPIPINRKRIETICTHDNSKLLYPNKYRFYFLIDFTWTTQKILNRRLQPLNNTTTIPSSEYRESGPPGRDQRGKLSAQPGMQNAKRGKQLLVYWIQRFLLRRLWIWLLIKIVAKLSYLHSFTIFGELKDIKLYNV